MSALKEAPPHFGDEEKHVPAYPEKGGEEVHIVDENGQGQLHRDLKGRHMQMIAM